MTGGAEIRDSFDIIGLQVNGSIKPMGADTKSIRFGWRLGSPVRGLEPQAYRIRVATVREKLREDQADVWDSGKVESGALYADYEGGELAGSATYWWSVTVWDRSGACKESEPEWFHTGLRQEQWKAEWIWSSDTVRVNDFAYFRSELVIRKPVAEATMYVSAHNVAQVYLNGVKIGGYGTPAPTNPWRRKYYAAYDVASFLQPGTSCIAAIAHYLGGDGQNYVNGLPGFRLQLEVRYIDGSGDTFTTDTSWKSIPDTRHRNETPYQQNRRISAIEDVDARKLGSEWMLAGFDTAACPHAVLSNSQMNGWTMVWQEIPEGAVEELIVPVETYRGTELQESGSQTFRQVFDAGKIVSGWPKARLAGIAGATVQLRYAEDLDENGFVRHNVSNEKSEHYYDRYTTGGTGTETWQPDLSYKAFRFVEATGYPEPLIPGVNLWIASAHTDMAGGGSFRCSNGLLNEMAQVCLQTQKNNTLGQTVDCPHREQAQYLADTDLQAETLLYNFDANHVLAKTLADFGDGQLENGTFPFVYPTNYGHRDFRLQIPEWDLHFCTLMWKIYWTYGDERLLERNYGTAKRMADHFISRLDAETGLVPADQPWHISDWPYSTVLRKAKYLTVENIKLAQAVAVMSRAASLLGKKDEADAYALTENRLREAIVDVLYDREAGLFRDGYESEQHHQGVNGLALHAGLFPEQARMTALEAVAAMSWDSRVVLSLPLLRALFEGGKDEAAYRLIAREQYPGWGYMIRQGAKTLWEGWDDRDSHCHAWNGYPLRLLQEFVAGIRSVSPGFGEVEVRPYMPDDLDYAEASVPTVRGEVFARWERRQASGNRSWCFVLVIPHGAKGRLVVRHEAERERTRITESGQPVWEQGSFTPGVDGVSGCRWNGDTVELDLASGRYEFEFEFAGVGI
ncbi:family 78 glycoside hydrolase catalytic domain [Paenibacillus mesophilus]|uniref:family 78 glycoside hydrolase catalytic domain n=1 Tax=Paenibacillus mesophilus TaxID=2582849 RepID=UPI001EE4AED1|nr:family 78 glycoside hydrolase catalytic domain [Paenibacillus mesophilus]